MKRNVFIGGPMLSVLVLAILAATGAAANSNTVSYQGVLRDAALVPVADDTYDMRFSIFSVDTGGASVWGPETQTVSTRNGLFSVNLGSVVSLGAVFANYAALWLQIEVDLDGGAGFEVYSPRVPLASVPYAQKALNAANATNATNAGNADTVDGLHVSDIQALINAVANQVTPIGTIVGWHKSLAGVPALPGTWVECNGGTVNDAASPLNNQAIPNLNGEARFLRGGGTSGVSQNDQLQGHIHTTNTVRPNILLGNYQPEPNQGWWAGRPQDQRGGLAQWVQNAGGLQSIYRQDEHNHTVSPPTNDGTNGAPRFGTETRPTNMSVVWIMRIK